MAHGEAPNSGLDEQKLDLKTVTSDPPTLNQPDKWSPEFLDFLSNILVKEPNKRATAAELLYHPFLKHAGTKNSFAHIVATAKLSRKHHPDVPAAPVPDLKKDWELFARRGIAIHDFRYSEEVDDGADAWEANKKLALLVGDVVIITFRKDGWYKGFRKRVDGKDGKGIFPASAIRLHEKRSEARGSIVNNSPAQADLFRKLRGRNGSRQSLDDMTKPSRLSLGPAEESEPKPEPPPTTTEPAQITRQTSSRKRISKFRKEVSSIAEE
eukprot:c14489_g1_i3.p1 GENE.c14489_g1_i3~~c14489_g1_i3.p1  ORF type:complete len:268 (-),score=51.34 c14489_g1_i3:91-894(-)